MINLNELRRGNLIEYDEDAEIVTVERIDERGVAVNWNKEKLDWVWCEADAFSPIDLTLEWFEKAEFRKKEYNKRILWYEKPAKEFKDYEPLIFFELAEKELFVYYNASPYLTYGECEIAIIPAFVHVLQNFFYALTNKELEFNHESN